MGVLWTVVFGLVLTSSRACSYFLNKMLHVPHVVQIEDFGTFWGIRLFLVLQRVRQEYQYNSDVCTQNMKLLGEVKLAYLSLVQRLETGWKQPAWLCPWAAKSGY